MIYVRARHGRSRSSASNGLRSRSAAAAGSIKRGGGAQPYEPSAYEMRAPMIARGIILIVGAHRARSLL